MNRISDIISTPVISLYESEYLGIIYNLLFDYRQKKCKYACILDEKNNVPQIIKFCDLFIIGKDCIYIKNKSVINLQTNCEKELTEYSNPINLKVYNLNCNYLGTSTDIVLEDTDKIEKIILNNGNEINSNEIFNFGKSVIIISNDKTVSPQKYRPPRNIIKTKDTRKVMILSDFIKSENENQINITTPPDTNYNKVITDFRFLVGRILSQDIIAMNGELIAKKNSIITKDIVNRASFYGKLVEVARYSKK